MSETLLGQAREAQQSGRFAEAAELYSHILSSDSNNVIALLAFGRTLQAMNRRAEALPVFDRILTLDPGNADARLQRANTLLALHRFDSAIAAFDTYLVSNPSSGEGWHNRAIALAETKRFALAAQSFGKALALRPDSVASWHNRGLSFAGTGDFEQAVRDHMRALALQPDLPDLRGDLILARLNCCDWQGFEDERLKIAQALSNGKPAIVPFGNLLISHSPADQMQCAQLWMARHVVSPPPLWRGERYNHARLRIAYVSGDFRAHPVASLMLPMFENHNRERFELFGISFGPDDNSDMRRCIRTVLENFIDVRGRSDIEVAVQLRGREIDIAVDLMGITESCRPGIFAARPAPVQVGYLGYPGTTGADFMDYIVADRIVIPENEQHYYTEKIAWLPGGYLPWGENRLPRGRSSSRADAGLPENAFVFCCFNGNYKILPAMFASWMAILRATEGSVLWLADPNLAARANLRREAERDGVAADRLIFAPHVSTFTEHLNRLGAADLFLDTAPFNAHSTAIDVLSAGVPVLTCAGSTMAGRAGASLLAAVGLLELIAGSLQDYERTAIALAHDAGALAAIRQKMAGPLFDIKAFTRQFEAALCEMHNQGAIGLPPHSFAVSGNSV
jgi:protein O-GlcNAc transferase